MPYRVVYTLKKDVLKARAASCPIEVLLTGWKEFLKRISLVNGYEPISKCIITGVKRDSQPYLEFLLA
jgi:hypothetical protein